MMDRRNLIRQAISAALRTRKTAGCGLDQAICVYDLAERLGIEVRFVNLPSLEGMYCDSPNPVIILSSLRPPGRRAFTCAHELGHHVLEHGVRIDEFVEHWGRRQFDSEEFMADCFAGALLMPKMAVSRTFAQRGWDAEKCTPAQAYAVSNYFGVGYTTVIHHMHLALKLLPESHALALLKVRPREAQGLLLGWQTTEPVYVVDSHWEGRPVDLEVGDLIFVFGNASLEGHCIQSISDRGAGRLFQATKPGIGRLVSKSGWASFVRVSRHDFVGRSLFRHWEEVEGE